MLSAQVLLQADEAEVNKRGGGEVAPKLQRESQDHRTDTPGPEQLRAPERVLPGRLPETDNRQVRPKQNDAREHLPDLRSQHFRGLPAGRRVHSDAHRPGLGRVQSHRRWLHGLYERGRPAQQDVNIPVEPFPAQLARLFHPACSYQ